MKFKKYILLILMLITYEALNAQYIKAPIDTVISFTPGTGQNDGQGEQYFPENIFGMPDKNADDNTQSTAPEEILSLGFGGTITVGFKGRELVNGDGPDFTIFENAFINPFNGKYFAEPAIVSVSYDGINFTEFPYDTLTLEGLAGVNPTHGSEDPYDPTVSGGDSFDLGDIGVDKIKYIRLQDVSKIIADNPDHPFWDATITGFDLDALVGLHLQQISSISEIITEEEIFRTEGNVILIDIEDIDPRAEFSVYTLNGDLISEEILGNRRRINLGHLPSAAYAIVFQNYRNIHTKILIIQ